MCDHAPISINIEIDPTGFICPPPPPDKPCVLNPEEMLPPPIEGLERFPGAREPGSTSIREKQPPVQEAEICAVELPPELACIFDRLMGGKPGPCGDDSHGDRPKPDKPDDKDKFKSSKPESFDKNGKDEDKKPDEEE